MIVKSIDWKNNFFLYVMYEFIVWQSTINGRLLFSTVILHWKFVKKMQNSMRFILVFAASLLHFYVEENVKLLDVLRESSAAWVVLYK